jgi:hypothetical protein
MDGATIQQRVYAGRGKAAARIGLSCAIMRPTGATATHANVGSTPAAFNAGDSTYKAPNMPGDPIWYADIDGRLIQQGDYLVRQVDGAMWYVAGMQQLLPIIVIDCNRMVTVQRAQQSTAPGAVGYGGVTPSSLVTILGSNAQKWGASILIGGRKDQAANLPAGVKNAGWRIMLPPSVTVTLTPGDVISDDLGRRYVVDACENTDLGWRMTGNEIHT